MPRTLLASLTVLLAAAAGATAAESVLLEVDAGPRDRIDCPVTFELPDAQAGWQHFVLRRVSDGADVAVERVPGGARPAVAWLIRKRLEAGARRRYRLSPADSPAAGPPPGGVTCRDDGKHLRVAVGGLPVLEYNHAVIESPPPLDPFFRRSGYIHPLYSPSGRVLTDDFPPDHAHQHALFFSWVNTTFAGRHPDFWNQAKGTGRIEHVRFAAPATSGPVFAQFTAVLRHSDTTQPDRPVAVLEETWTVRVWNLKPYFLFDVHSSQRCASGEPLTINEYHYGGMAIRGSRQWFDEGVARQIATLRKHGAPPEELAKISPPRDYLTSEGKTWIDGNATRARWVEMHGPIDGREAGFTVICHPGNFRAPQPVRLHPEKPYFCFAPMILGGFSIDPGRPFVSRYRYYLHDGPVDPARSERLWYDYAHPPEVGLVGGRGGKS